MNPEYIKTINENLFHPIAKGQLELFKMFFLACINYILQLVSFLSYVYLFTHILPHTPSSSLPPPLTTCSFPAFSTFTYVYPNCVPLSFIRIVYRSMDSSPLNAWLPLRSLMVLTGPVFWEPCVSSHSCRAFRRAAVRTCSDVSSILSPASRFCILSTPLLVLPALWRRWNSCPVCDWAFRNWIQVFCRVCLVWVCACSM